MEALLLAGMMFCSPSAADPAVFIEQREVLIFHNEEAPEQILLERDVERLKHGDEPAIRFSGELFFPSACEDL